MDIGRFNSLEVVSKGHKGYELSNEDGVIAFYATSIKDNQHMIGDYIDVFVYKDSRNELKATEQCPKVMLNEFGYLKVNEVNDFGAFLDWGLDKDLFVPYSEQDRRMMPSRKYLVFVYLDAKSNRLAGSTRVNRYFEQEDYSINIDDKVDLLAYEFTEIGMQVVINNKYRGLLYASETFQTVRPGDKLVGYIKNIREDGKIDVSLQPQGVKNIEPSAAKVLEELKRIGGFLELNDKSDPLDISYALEMSKKSFKKAIGSLYKQRIIRIEEDGIYLIEKESES